MRSDILAEELRQRREAKRLKHRRALNRKHSRAFRKRQKAKLAIVKQEQERAESLAVLAIETRAYVAAHPERKQLTQEEWLEYSHKETARSLALYDTPVKDKPPEPKRRIPPPFDLPNGIIL